MNTIQLKAPAKINLGLDVLRKREDNYHEVKMIMQTIDIYDILTFSETEETKIQFESNDPGICSEKDNLVYKAANLLFQKYKPATGVSIHLDKHIPVAAGMAGGSTDAATTLIGLNQLWELGLSTKELQKLGVTLGADIPYCIMRGTALSEGIGEKLTPLPPMPDCFILVAKPPVSVSTKYVYENLHANELKEHPDVDGIVEALERNSLSGICDRLGNVLETVTLPLHPCIQDLKDLMTANGALSVLMSGSGPTVFGIYNDQDAVKKSAALCKKNNSQNRVFISRPVEALQS